MRKTAIEGCIALAAGVIGLGFLLLYKKSKKFEDTPQNEKKKPEVTSPTQPSKEEMKAASEIKAAMKNISETFDHTVEGMREEVKEGFHRIKEDLNKKIEELNTTIKKEKEGVNSAHENFEAQIRELMEFKKFIEEAKAASPQSMADAYDEIMKKVSEYALAKEVLYKETEGSPTKKKK